MNIPNILTILRVVSIPVFVLLYLIPWSYSYIFASFIFACASVTDWLDGYLARIWNQTTRFGAFLDPVADKLIVAIALIAITSSYDHALLTLCSMVIIGREITVSALREWMAQIGVSSKVAVSILGKIKTMAQMVAITILLALPPDTSLWQTKFGIVSLCIASLLTLISMLDYLRIAYPYLKDGQH